MFHHELETMHGQGKAVEVEMLVVDGNHAGEYQSDRRVYNTAVVDVLDAEGVHDGDLFAGRLETWTTRAGYAAVVFRDAIGDDVERAKQAWARRRQPGPVDDDRLDHPIWGLHIDPAEPSSTATTSPFPRRPQ